MKKMVIVTATLILMMASGDASLRISVGEGCAEAGSQQQIPAEIADRYAAVPDQSISDEFNDGELDTSKWAYRTESGAYWKTGPEYVAFESEGTDRYVSIKGKWDERCGSGIAAKNEARFGFYSMRWRTDNIRADLKTPWHPAVWMAFRNFAAGEDRRRIASVDQFIEIDFMEYWHYPVWHVQTIAWENGKNIGIQKMYGEAADFPTEESGWMILGLEYTPDYLQLWIQKKGVWAKMGTRISITQGETSTTELNEKFATPGYWILSNKYHWPAIERYHKGNPDLSEFRLEDSALLVDWFRYFPVK